MHTAAAALLVGAGGFAGAVARWALGASVQAKSLHPHFPVHTFVVNLLGCLAIGVAYGLWEKHETFRLLVIVGFLGGFTTFSTFGWETLSLLRDGRVALAAGYVALSATLGVVLVWLGLKLAGSLS